MRARRSPIAPTSGSIATSPWRAAGSRAFRRSSARSGSHARFGLETAADPGVGAGSTFGGTCAAYERRLAQGTVTLERPSETGSTHNDPPIVNVRHFPRLERERHDEPAVHELVRSSAFDRSALGDLGGQRHARALRRPGRGARRARPGARRQGLSLHARLLGRRPRDPDRAVSGAATKTAIAEVAGVEVSTDHFIGGERVASAERFDDLSPIDGQVLARVSAGGPEEAEAARRAPPPRLSRTGPALGPEGRRPYLDRLADLIDEQRRAPRGGRVRGHGDAARVAARARDLARRAQLPRLRRARRRARPSGPGARTAPPTGCCGCPPARRS